LVWLGNYGHISYEKQQELLREIGGIEIGIGTLQATNARVADAVLPAVEDLWQWAPLQPNIHVDETPPVCQGHQRMVDRQPQVKIFACFMLPTLSVAQN